MKEIEIKYWDISKVIPYEKNPRFNDNAVDEVAKSIDEFGFKNPIVVDENNIIINGHTRLKAAKKLGLETVPVIKASDLTEEQVKAYRLADNRVAEHSTWDNKLLLQELNDLDKLDVFTGFTESDIFEDVLDESDKGPVEENNKGVTYSLHFSTQDEEKFWKIKNYIEEQADVE